PFLPHRRHRAIGVADRLHLLPGDIRIVSVTEGRLEPRHLHPGALAGALIGVLIGGRVGVAHRRAPPRRRVEGGPEDQRERDTPTHPSRRDSGSPPPPAPPPASAPAGAPRSNPAPTAQRVHSSPRPRPRAPGIVPTSWIPATDPVATTIAPDTGRPSMRATTARTSGAHTARKVPTCASAASRGGKEATKASTVTAR